MLKHKRKQLKLQKQEYLQKLNNVQFAYDQSKGEEDHDYCKKCKYESKWCKHRQEREDAK